MISLARAPERPAPRLVRHWRALFRLAWPVALSRVGLVVMAMVNVIMVGRTTTDQLAALSLGTAVFMPPLIAGIGCMVGIVATTARAQGAGMPATPEIALRGLRWAVLVGGVAWLLLLAAGPLLRLIGHTPELVAGGGSVARVLAPGALFQIVFVATTFYLEGTGRPRPGLVAMAVANVLNVGFGWLLIGGRLGLPALGADGAALGATLARAAMAAGLLVWMLRLPEFAALRAAPLSRWGPGGWTAGREMRRIGMAGGAAYFFETFAFAALAQMAGLLGPAPLAAYTILHNIEALVFMIALGVSVATAVRVGQAAGAGDAVEARFAGYAGLAMATGLVGAAGLLLLGFAPSVVGFYSADPSLVARAAPIIAILAVSMVFDAGQVVLGQSTRALGDSWVTTGAFFFAFFCVMVPLGFVLAFRTPLAEAGLFVATAVGCATAAALLLARFLQLVRRVS
jgi:MATE family multidrug resistance protein